METTAAQRGAGWIEARELDFAYPSGPFRLRLAELRVARGERVACIGPSGSGKTTLVHLLAGVALPRSGSVRVGDTLVSGLGDAERRAWRLAHVGMVFQEFELLEYLSALDNVLLPYHLGAGLTLDGHVRRRAQRLAAELGIEHALARKPAALSQGERQRVALCRALVTEPELILADEATGNLDPDSAAASLALLFETLARRGATLFLVTHDHSLLPGFDRVVDMRALRAAEARA